MTLSQDHVTEMANAQRRAEASGDAFLAAGQARCKYESNMTYDYGYELMSCMSLFDPWRYLLPSRISVLRTLVGVFRTIWTSLPSESLSEDLRLKVE